MERGELEAAVARALIGAIWRDNPEVRDATEVQGEELLWAAAAIRVVVAEAQRSIEALGTDWTHVRAGVTSYEPAKAADFKREALAALSALVPPPPV